MFSARAGMKRATNMVTEILMRVLRACGDEPTRVYRLPNCWQSCSLPTRGLPECQRREAVGEMQAVSDCGCCLPFPNLPLLGTLCVFGGTPTTATCGTSRTAI